MTKPLSRRDFLKLGSSALAGMVFAPVMEALSAPLLGRIVYNKVTIYDAPHKVNAAKVGSYTFDTLVNLTHSLYGEEPGTPNPLWYAVQGGGYIHSAGVQIVKESLNPPVTEIPKTGGLLAELTVPYSDSHWKPTKNSRRGYRLYYGTTYWVRALFEDEEKQPWYRIYDDLMGLVFFVPAAHLRILPPEELAPLSPNIPEEEKRIVVSLPEQQMVAYEGDRGVYHAKISSGTGKEESHYASTPSGAFNTFFKRPAGHMVGGSGSGYDLPGVPWACYINNNGVSFHGTYWHNDFGVPHSHGCINLKNEDAKWLYRWTTPSVPEGKRQIYEPGTGTAVYISKVPVFQLDIL